MPARQRPSRLTMRGFGWGYWAALGVPGRPGWSTALPPQRNGSVSRAGRAGGAVRCARAGTAGLGANDAGS